VVCGFVEIGITLLILGLQTSTIRGRFRGCC